MITSAVRYPACGLSPRVRGNRVCAGAGIVAARSIPAGAGEPSRKASSRRGSRVYPRGCGGTRPRTRSVSRSRGLSPRVRGNLDAAAPQRSTQGSIPAGAGEPERHRCRKYDHGVYPRGCGGTTSTNLLAGFTKGLSPRVRGNRTATPRPRGDLGSIPAGAGEPKSGRSSAPRNSVYPRGCGGTSSSTSGTSLSRGLSPRVRGNQVDDRHPPPRRGSIPAGAGEPTASDTTGTPDTVYPRGCGGTVQRDSLESSCRGLSPRVRGNLLRVLIHVDRDGSIPAGAGEPWSAGRGNGRSRVYPRGCGGTSRSRTGRPGSSGLSPRVRGNQACRGFVRARRGSIPAGAGEPLQPAYG